ncbi:TetR family transcriptional regulator [Litoreibacter meonggei]|uniref:TetR family transcriptional regulator n=2 Tax=Litoreibacter meonggei TaxID=1049199 RepID=A0A497X407_9RHOB|nr:TetR/AcrR family transcriptional regulator [Litoreibacter meonggei]RLJ59124.1 TetR family transcriptional regulator [Litoreibacter meonggei]
MSSKINSTRDRILLATLNLLEAGGGSAVRMSDIAKAAKISRQALYLHFPNRAELLVATTRYLDELHEIEGKLIESRAANSGIERLSAWINFWGGYIPTVYGVSKALLAIKDSDEEAMLAWNDRMHAVRHGCAAAVSALKDDGKLVVGLSEAEATDFLWTLLSVRNWEMLRKDCGWTQDRYIEVMRSTAAAALVSS